MVLFDDALDHVVRIYRILSQNRYLLKLIIFFNCSGNLMLIGVGGSGRQSLTRVAAGLADIKTIQFDIRKSYRFSDWREDIKKLYITTAVERKKLVFLFSDTQITDESFLEDINNILSSGEITNLFPADELPVILDDVRPHAVAAGFGDTLDSLYSFMIESVRNNLHIVLCMSPIGKFRDYTRLYPALVHNTTLDWFSDWPDVALKEVSSRFLSGISLDSGSSSNKEVSSTDINVKDSLADFFVKAHTSVISMSQNMKQSLRRYNYVTPTNYLDLVSGYKVLLNEKRTKIGDAADKLRNGLLKLDEARTQVSEMTVTLEQKKKVVAIKKNESEKMLIEIVQQQRMADEQKKLVESEAVKIEYEEQECSVIACLFFEF